MKQTLQTSGKAGFTRDLFKTFGYNHKFQIKRALIFITLLILSTISSYAQKGIIEGVVTNPITNHPVEFASVVIYNTTIGTKTDENGKFKLTGLQTGYFRIKVSAIGFETTVTSEIFVTNSKPAFIEIEMNESTTQLEGVEVKATPFKRKDESPVSLRSLGIGEIEKSPGGNRDISKVVQTLPGVSGAASYRNDLVVRGGGPAENKFYLDGMEIPNINHFATQGASGGPIGIINVDFIREINFYSGAFQANRGPVLSSVLSMNQKDGNDEKMKYKATLGYSDLALSVDGPLGKNISMVASVRRSYLQFLFSMLELPFLPTYNDFQFKVKHKFNPHNEISFLGLGAIDQFKLNLDANKTESQRYILGYLPNYNQWNYTLGTVYKHYRDKSYQTFVLSRNHLNNVSFKYKDNVEVDSLKTIDYHSDEIENKFRFENNLQTSSGFKVNFGAEAEYAHYYNRTFQKIYLTSGYTEVNYKTSIDILKWSVFGQVTKSILNDHLIVSAGLRADANNYSTEMSNMLNQISPRVSFSIPFAYKWALNFNTGRYYQLPAYTTLGFKNSAGTLINKENGIRYIGSNHFVGGLEYQPSNDSKFTIEGFYKKYNHYPFSVNDSISIASKGSDYGSTGDEEVVSTGENRAYGAEVYFRHTNLWGVNTVLSYTWVRSEAKNFEGEYIPTSWDNKHIFNITATRTFKKNWDIGFKYRFTGGAPYTPYDEEKSSYVLAWDANGRGYYDYSKFNSKRLKPESQLDIRVDKSYFYDKWTLVVYLDVKNVLGAKTDAQDVLTNKDENGNTTIINPSAPIAEQKYQLRYLNNDGKGTRVPTLGIIVEF